MRGISRVIVEPAYSFHHGRRSDRLCDRGDVPEPSVGRIILHSTESFSGIGPLSTSTDDRFSLAENSPEFPDARFARAATTRREVNGDEVPRLEGNVSIPDLRNSWWHRPTIIAISPPSGGSVRALNRKAYWTVAQIDTGQHWASALLTRQLPNGPTF